MNPIKVTIAILMVFFIQSAFPEDDQPLNPSQISFLKERDDQGLAFAQYNLGVRYYKGEGVSQDYQEAARWFRLAADQGQPRAQASLGVMYRDGNGITQDYKEAIRWFRLAADQGHARAQNHLGLMYARGEGVKQDSVLAYMWANLAASQLTGKDREGAVELKGWLTEGTGELDVMTPEEIAKAQRLALEWKPKRSGSQ